MCQPSSQPQVDLQVWNALFKLLYSGKVTPIKDNISTRSWLYRHKHRHPNPGPNTYLPGVHFHLFLLQVFWLECPRWPLTSSWFVPTLDSPFTVALKSQIEFLSFLMPVLEYTFSRRRPCTSLSLLRDGDFTFLLYKELERRGFPLSLWDTMFMSSNFRQFIRRSLRAKPGRTAQSCMSWHTSGSLTLGRQSEMKGSHELKSAR